MTAETKFDLPTPSRAGVLVIAHRGGMGLWPPNTLYAFDHALDLGADVLEMDVHSTADGRLAVRHNPTVDETTDGSGLIQEFTLQELKKLDAGYTWTADGGKSYPYRGQGIQIPTFEEVLTAFPGAYLNIDIKPEDPAVIEPFCRLLEKYGRLDQVTVGSFHNRQIRAFRARCPQVPTAASVAESQIFYILNLFRLAAVYRPKAQAFQAMEYYRRLHVVNKGFIKTAHKTGLQVHVWTVNSRKDMQRLIDWGVDGLISDYPDRLIELLE
jgi:glycerophosphoryl diester phosphodiesterase